MSPRGQTTSKIAPRLGRGYGTSNVKYGSLWTEEDEIDIRICKAAFILGVILSITLIIILGMIWIYLA